jgi:hypothetical protein
LNNPSGISYIPKPTALDSYSLGYDSAKAGTTHLPKIRGKPSAIGLNSQSEELKGVPMAVKQPVFARGGDLPHFSASRGG